MTSDNHRSDWDLKRRRPIPDARPGEGSLNEQEIYIDKNRLEYGPKSAAATRIGSNSERDGDRERLSQLNNGRHRSDGQHSARAAKWDKQRITEALCSRLELSSLQENEAARMMKELDLDAFGSEKSLEKVALAVIKFVVNRDRAEQGSLEHRISEDDTFQKLVSEFDLETGMSRLSRSVKEQLKQNHLLRGKPTTSTDSPENRGSQGAGRDFTPDPALPDRDDRDSSPDIPARAAENFEY